MSAAPLIADEVLALRGKLRAQLLAERSGGHWRGELAASALSTAIAIVALRRAGDGADHARIVPGLRWLLAHQNADGSWGDTVLSIGNLSTTVLVWAAWISARAGGLAPAQLRTAIEVRYGNDRTFAVPILTLCAIAGRLGEDPWRWVRPLPFELAACPRAAFRFLDLQVVSYALPALIAVGMARFRCRPPRNPFARAARALAAKRTLRLLENIQPASGGFLEASPLTGFVVMSLAAAQQEAHPTVARGLDFLRRGQRDDGSWAIDSDLATWVSTGALNALAAGGGLDEVMPPAERRQLRDWLLAQQQRGVHPYTGSPPGGWAWTDLSGGVPDADDTAGALIALHHLDAGDATVVAAAHAGLAWLAGLQNRDGGIPTFCRGWGALQFDRSAPDLTAHALIAMGRWRATSDGELRTRIDRMIACGLGYLRGSQRADGAWVPLWFGNQHVPDDLNPTYATARVVQCLRLLEPAGAALAKACGWLCAAQNPDGGWGGGGGTPSSIEETGLALEALAADADPAILAKGVTALRRLTAEGSDFPPAPIGFYFAKLWYFERLYPLIFATAAIERLAARAVPAPAAAPASTAVTV